MMETRRDRTATFQISSKRPLTSAVWQDAIAGDLGLGAGPMPGGWKAVGNMGNFTWFHMYIGIQVFGHIIIYIIIYSYV